MKREFRCPCCGEFVAAALTAARPGTCPKATCPQCRGLVMVYGDADPDDPHLNPPPRRRSVAARVRAALAKVTGG